MSDIEVSECARDFVKHLSYGLKNAVYEVLREKRQLSEMYDGCRIKTDAVLLAAFKYLQQHPEEAAELWKRGYYCSNPRCEREIL